MPSLWDVIYDAKVGSSVTVTYIDPAVDDTEYTVKAALVDLPDSSDKYLTYGTNYKASTKEKRINKSEIGEPKVLGNKS